MILYILQSSVVLILLYGIFGLLLKNSKLFKFNRFFLIGSLLFALLIPSLQVEFNTKNEVIKETVNQVEILEAEILPFISNHLEIGDPKSKTISWNNILLLSYLIGVIIMIGRFIIHLNYLFRLSHKKGPKIAGMQSILLKEGTNPFSFFSYLFIAEKQLETIKNNKSIINHEKAHCKQLHSVDILFIELLQCLFWFQPLLIPYKKEIKNNHEFLADAYACSKENKRISYLNNLLNFIEDNNSPILSSGFSYLIIKNRIKMIQKKQPKSLKRKLSLISALLITTIVLISSAFKPAPINEVLYLPIFNVENEGAIKPSIFPIEQKKIKKISSYYGMRYNPINNAKKLHTGIDFIAEKGTPILATADGIIEKAEYSQGYGKHIKIKHNKIFQTTYAHLSEMKVKEGDKVAKGDIIGIIGNTGRSMAIHLHYEVIKGDEKVDPIDYFPNELKGK